MEQSLDVIPRDHPSFGTERAVYIFALGQGPVRLLTVEATNKWAVMCLERILLTDQKVSDNCYVIQVVRDYREVGTRNEFVQEPTFAEFCIDIVDPDRMFSDAVTLECFQNALSDNERQAALTKLQTQENAQKEVENDDFFASLHQAAQVPQLQSPDQSEKLSTALIGLGFKKPEVRRFVSSLGERARTEDLHSLLREGLRVLAA